MKRQTISDKITKLLNDGIPPKRVAFSLRVPQRDVYVVVRNMKEEKARRERHDKFHDSYDGRTY